MTERGRFIEQSTFPADARPVASGTSGFRAGKATLPDGAGLRRPGKKFWGNVAVHGDWTTTYIPFPDQGPLETGNWSVQVRYGGTPGLISKFRVVNRKPG